MSTNWMRHFELQLIDDKGQGIVLSDFKVTFSIQRNDNRWPATAAVSYTHLTLPTNREV